MATLHVPSTDSPTIFNKTAMVGAAIGSLFTPVLGTAVGGLIGGYLGKQRMETEQVTGKDVKEPSFFNSGIVIGLAIGAAALLLGGGLMIAGGGIGGAAIGAATGASLVSTALIAGVGAVGAGIFAIGAPVIGAIAGGLIGKNSQAKEYAAAQQQIALQTPAVNLSARAPSPYVITPEQQQALSAAQAAGRAGGAQGPFTGDVLGGQPTAPAVAR